MEKMERESFDKVKAVGWYPGHMLKARRKIAEKLKLLDVIVELRDARLPMLSANPDLQDITGGKPRIILLNKCGLAERQMTKEWITYFRNEKLSAMEIDCLQKINIKKLPDLIKKIAAEHRKKRSFRKEVRCLIAGIPNVGKSTLVNTMAKGKKAAVGARPGVTKGQQWIKLGEEIELLDTPGILWPKIETREHELQLALTGAIKDRLIGPRKIAEFLHQYILKNSEKVVKQYRLSVIPEDSENLLEKIAEWGGFISLGGSCDLQQSAIKLINDYRQGKFGNFTLEDFPEK
ncbi:MAG: ribosome biogenesis GTPase YlqF [Verrucomicrobiota bacterium]|nr:ribosome biogenesis GTPase YlqF [Verrucomicrobiota bacterium]